MLDPAIMFELQRAMVPPSLPPLAVVRERMAPQDTHRQAVARAMLAAAEYQLVGWHGKIDEQLATFQKLEHVVWDDSDRVMFDRMIVEAERMAEASVDEIDRQHRRDLRGNDRLAKRDPVTAREDRDFVNKIYGWKRDNVEKILDVALHLRAIRAQFDGRSKVVGTYDDPDELTAFLEATIAA